MPLMTNHHSKSTTKGIIVGDSGAGKTSSLISLAAMGLNVRIIDTDNGTDIIKGILSDPKSGYNEPQKILSKIEYVPLDEPKRKNPKGFLIPAKAEVWTKTLDLLNDWVDGDIKHGHLESWTSQDVLVFDSLSSLSRAALRHQLAMNGRLGQTPWESDWGQAQELIRGLFEMVTDDSIKCNVLFLCHTKPIDVNGISKSFPNTLGKALPKEMGRYFNTILLVEASGIGANTKRKIITQPRGTIDLKNTAPFRVQSEYDIKDGLAEYFKAVRG